MQVVSTTCSKSDYYRLDATCMKLKNPQLASRLSVVSVRVFVVDFLLVNINQGICYAKYTKWHLKVNNLEAFVYIYFPRSE